MNGLLKEKKAVIALGAVGAVALLAAAWFLVVAPQQSKADDLDRQVADGAERACPAQDRPRHPVRQGDGEGGRHLSAGEGSSRRHEHGRA